MRHWASLLGILALLLANPATAEENPSGLPELTPEELEKYAFDIEEDPPVVGDLSVGQRYVLSSQRREVADLVARRLGVLSLKGDKRDLTTLQSVVDKDLIRQGEVREWQGLGVVFGDILVREMNLHWISYEDDVGVSKALRWRDTENYVFPVTMFSKRVQFNEDIDVFAIYAKIEEDVERFKEFERNRPQFDR